MLPSVALVGHEAVQDRQRGRLAAARVVLKGADEGWRVREALFGQHATDLHLGMDPGLEPTEDLQDELLAVDD